MSNTIPAFDGNANVMYQNLLSDGNFGGLGDDGLAFDQAMGSNFQAIRNTSTNALMRADEQRQEMDKLNADAQKVTQQNMKDSIKVGIANLLAKSYNMLTQSHLSLAKEAIEVAKTSV